MAGSQQFNVNLAINANTSQARTQLQSLQKQLEQLTKDSLSKDRSLGFSKDLQKSIQLANQLNSVLKSSTNSSGLLDLSKFNQSLAQSQIKLSDYRDALQSLGPAGEQAFNNFAKSITSAEVQLKKSQGVLQSFATTLANTAKWQISSNIMHGLEGALNSAFSYAKNLDQSLNNIRIVTGQSSEQMSVFAERANKAAQALSTTTGEYAKASLIFYQQGLNDNEVEQRTNAVIKMAHATGDAAKDVSSYMTAIWNNFDDGSESLEHYADVITALGASTASSSSEISEGLSKFAAIAKTTGLSYEYATASLATLVANTRESADTIGNSLKTIFARLQGLQLGETLEDGVDLNKYSKALKTVGVDVLDMNGQLRDADDILEDMAGKWQNLTRAQKVALAQTVAGTRQYAVLTSLMESWDDMETNLTTARGANGTLEAQADIYAQSWEAARNRVRAAAEDIYASLIDPDFFIGVDNVITKILQSISKLIDKMGGITGVISAISLAASKLLQNQLANTFNNIGNSIDKITGKAAQKSIQTKRDINQLMIDNAVNADKGSSNVIANSYKQEAEARDAVLAKQQELIAQGKTLNEQEATLLQQYLQQNEALNEQVRLTAQQEGVARKTAQHQDLVNQQLLKKSGASQEQQDQYNSTLKNIKNKIEGNGELSSLTSAAESILSDGGGIKELENVYNQVFDNISKKAQESGQKIEAYIGYKGKKALEDFKAALSSGDVNAAKAAIDALNSAVARNEAQIQLDTRSLRNLFSALGLDTKAVDELVKKYQELKQAQLDSGDAQSRAGAHMKNLETTLKNVGKEIPSIGKNLAGLTQGLSSCAMAINTIKGLGSIWGDKTLDDGEKLLSTLTSLGMLLPTLVNGIGAVNKALTGLGMSNPWAAALTAIIAVGTAIWGLVSAQDAYNKKLIETKRQQANDLREISEKTTAENNSRQQLLNEYEKAFSTWNSTKTGQEELAEAAQKVADAYDIQFEKLYMVTGQYEKLMEKAREASIEEAARAAEESKQAYESDQGLLFVDAKNNSNIKINENFNEEGNRVGNIGTAFSLLNTSYSNKIQTEGGFTVAQQILEDIANSNEELKQQFENGDPNWLDNYLGSNLKSFIESGYIENVPQAIIDYFEENKNGIINVASLGDFLENNSTQYENSKYDPNDLLTNLQNSLEGTGFQAELDKDNNSISIVGGKFKNEAEEQQAVIDFYKAISKVEQDYLAQHQGVTADSLAATDGVFAQIHSILTQTEGDWENLLKDEEAYAQNSAIEEVRKRLYGEEEENSKGKKTLNKNSSYEDIIDFVDEIAKEQAEAEGKDYSTLSTEDQKVYRDAIYGALSTTEYGEKAANTQLLEEVQEMSPLLKNGDFGDGKGLFDWYDSLSEADKTIFFNMKLNETTAVEDVKNFIDYQNTLLAEEEKKTAFNNAKTANDAFQKASKDVTSDDYKNAITAAAKEDAEILNMTLAEQGKWFQDKEDQARKEWIDQLNNDKDDIENTIKSSGDILTTDRARKGYILKDENNNISEDYYKGLLKQYGLSDEEIAEIDDLKSKTLELIDEEIEYQKNIKESAEAQKEANQAEIDYEEGRAERERKQNIENLSKKDLKIGTSFNTDDISAIAALLTDTEEKAEELESQIASGDFSNLGTIKDYLQIGADGYPVLIKNAEEFNDVIQQAKFNEYKEGLGDLTDPKTLQDLALMKEALLSMSDAQFAKAIQDLEGVELPEGWLEFIENLRKASDTSKDSVENLSQYISDGTISAENYVSRLIALLDIDSSTGTEEALEQLIEKLKTGEIEVENFQSGINQLLGRAQSLDEKNAIIDKVTAQQYDEKGNPLNPAYTDEQIRHMSFNAAKDSSNKYTSDAARIAQMEGVMADAKAAGAADEEIKQYQRDLTDVITTSNQLNDAQKELKINELWAGQEGTYEYNMVMIDLIANMKDLTDAQRQAKLEALGITEASPLWEYYRQIITDTLMSIKDFSAALKDLNPGETINKDVFDQLMAVAPQLQSSFMDMGNGTYTLLTNAEALRTVMLDVYADSKNGDNFAYTNEQLAAQAETLSELDYLDSKRGFTQEEYLKAEAAIGLQHENAKEESLTLLQLLQEQKTLQDEIAALENQKSLTNEQQVELERLKTEEIQKQADLEAAKVNSDVAIGAAESADQFGVDAQAVEDLAKYYLELAENGDEAYQSIKGNGKAAVDEARQMIRASEACEDLSKNSSKYAKVLEGLNGDTKTYTKTLLNNSKEIKALKKDVAGILDTTEDYIDTNTLAKMSLEDIQKAAEGNIPALRKLQAEQAKALASSNGISSEVADQFNNAMSNKGENESVYTEGGYDEKGIKTNAVLDMDIAPFMEAMATAIAEAGGGAEELQAALSGVGIEMDNTMFFNSLQEAEEWAAESNNRVIQNLAVDAKPNATTQESHGTKDDVGFDEEISWDSSSRTSNILKDGADNTEPVTQTYWTASKIVTPKKVVESEEAEAPVVAVGYENPHTGSSAGGKVAPSSGGRGGGGGGGSRAPRRAARRATARRSVDKSHQPQSQISKSLANQTKAYANLSKATEQAFGKSKLKNMQQEIDLQNKIIKKTQELTKETRRLVNEEKNRLSGGNKTTVSQYVVKKWDAKNKQYDEYLNTSKKGKKITKNKSNEFNITDILGNKFQYDEFGNIKNELDIEEALINRENKAQDAVDKIKNDGKKKAAALNAQARIQAENEAIRAEMEKYKQDVSDYWDNIEKEIEARLDREAKQLEKRQYELEIKIEVNEEELERLERLLTRYEKINSTLFSGNSIDQFNNLRGQQKEKENEIKNQKAHAKNILMDNGATEKEANDFLDKGIYSKTSAWYTSLNTDEMKELQSVRSEILSLATAYGDLSDAILELASSTMDQWNQSLDFENSKLETGLSTLEHYGNVIDIVGKKYLGITTQQRFDLRMSQIDQRQSLARAAKDQYEFAEENRKIQEKTYKKLQEQYKEAVDTGNQETIDELAKMVSVQKKVYDDSVRNANEALQSWEGKVEEALESVQEAFQAMSDDIYQDLTSPIYLLLSQNGRNKDKGDGFHDITTGLYELAKLEKDVNASLDDATGVKNKEALAKVLDKINKAREKGVELSEYETEELRKEYELELARQKMEEARNAKSEVRLTRDSEGNFSYVYTSDESAMAEAESEYEDKLQELYELNRNYIDEVKDKLLGLPQEMADALAELDEQIIKGTIDEEQYQKEAQRIREFYGEIMETSSNELEMALGNQSNLYVEHYQQIADQGKAIAEDKDFIDSWKELEKALNMSEVLETDMDKLEDFKDFLDQKFNTTLSQSIQKLGILGQNFETANDEGSLDENGNYVGKEGSTDLIEDAVQDVADMAETTEDNIKDLKEEGIKDISQLGSTISTWASNAVTNFNSVADAVTGVTNNLQKLTKDLTENSGYELLLKNLNMNTASARSAVVNSLLSDSSFVDSNKVIKTSNVITNLKARGITEEEEIIAILNAMVAGRAGYSLEGLTGNNYGNIKQALAHIGSFDTGGYTGDWGDSSGRLAMLHNKELVLNQSDTQNILDVVSIIRDISNTINLNALTAQSNLFDILGRPSMNMNNSDRLEQYVTITLDAPNLTDKNSAMEIFDNVINLASQYAYKR